MLLTLSFQSACRISRIYIVQQSFIVCTDNGNESDFLLIQSDLCNTLNSSNLVIGICEFEVND